PTDGSGQRWRRNRSPTPPRAAHWRRGHAAGAPRSTACTRTRSWPGVTLLGFCDLALSHGPRLPRPARRSHPPSDVIANNRQLMAKQVYGRASNLLVGITIVLMTLAAIVVV